MTLDPTMHYFALLPGGDGGAICGAAPPGYATTIGSKVDCPECRLRLERA